MAEPDESEPTGTPDDERSGAVDAESGGDGEGGGHAGRERSGTEEAPDRGEHRSPAPVDPESLDLSTSVDRAAGRFDDAEPISAAALVEAILDVANHRERYAGGRAAGLTLPGREADERRPVGAWLAGVRELFDPERAEELHGRLVIVGLSLLDRRLREQLRHNGFLPALEDEIRESIDELLTTEGWRRRTVEDTVPNQPDEPLEALERDQLGRAAFADYLARRIDAVPTDDSYAIHLYGPWGAGKSTLFNFLGAKLRRRPELSSAVHAALDTLPDDERVGAAAVVEAILDGGDPPRREVYAGGRAPDLSVADANDGPHHPVIRRLGPQRVHRWLGDLRARVDPNRRGRRPVETWLRDVRALFDRERAPVLTGRLVVVGLAWLDPQVRAGLAENDVLSALEAELEGPPADLLTDRGWRKYEPARPRREADSGDGSRAPDRSGSTASSSARRPRGSERSAPAADPWVVVEFNAWQHQHVQPPWWPLVNQVFHESKAELRHRDRLKEYLWRVSGGWLPAVAGVVVLAILLAAAFSTAPGTPPGEASLVSLVVENAAVISASLALGGLVWAGIQVASKPFLLRSAAAARSYIRFTSDPMNGIKERFETLVDRIPARVAVFVDDLDRCESAYVVELLEGIQTLFKDAPVVFVVAADRHWLTTCFEREFEGQAPAVQDPDKTLGTLFLEKVFQVSTPLPGISDDLKRAYWQTLIRVEPDDADDEIEAARSAARDLVAGTDTEGELRRLVAEGDDLPFWRRRARREEAAKRYASTEIRERSEHVLKPFASLLEPNPRAMKRLVNAYNVNLVLMTLADVEIERDQLALWTILTLNWPELATYLADDPAAVERIERGEVADVGWEGTPPVDDPDVVDVVTGAPVTAKLTPDVVADCATIHA